MTEEKKLKHFGAKALFLMKKHGLWDWKFSFNNRSNIYGICYLNRKEIKLSKIYVTQAPETDIVDTIKHEIAHALAFVRYGDTGHGPGWKAQCRQIGARPERCSQVILKLRYALVCKKCGPVGYLARVPRVNTIYCCPTHRYSNLMLVDTQRPEVYKW